MKTKLGLIRTISNRLMGVLTILVCLFIPGAFYTLYHGGIPTALAVFAVGIVGGVVGLHRRLKKMSDDDLVLLANSWVYVCLSPLVGGILAVVTYVCFVSELLKGDFFPKFVQDDAGEQANGLGVLFSVHCAAAADYGKALLWAFIAGFSERFATDIISRFDSEAADVKNPDEPGSVPENKTKTRSITPAPTPD